MTSVVATVFEDGVLRAFDGGRHSARETASKVIALADRVVVIGAELMWPHVRGARPDQAIGALIDVSDVGRLLGYGEGTDVVFGLIREAVPPAYRAVELRLEAMHRIGRRFDEVIPESERRAMRRMLRINDRGIALDHVRAMALAGEFRRERDEALREVRLSLPCTELSTIRSEVQFRDQIVRRFGVELSTTALGKVDGAVGSIVDARRRFIEFDKAASLMMEVGRKSGALTSPLKYCGASTGRYSSSGRFNILALPRRPHPSLRSLVAIRDVVVPPPGKWFVARDLHAIEARVLAYLSGQADLVARFRAGADVYAEFASTVWPGREINKQGPNAHLREIGKVAVLSLGFGVGFETFSEAVREKAPDSNLDELRRAFDGFGRTYPRLMGELVAAETAIHRVLFDSPRPGTVCRASIERRGNVLEVELPSDRVLYYRGLAIGTLPNGDRTLWWCRSSTSAPGELGPAEAVPWDREEFRFADGVVRERLRAHALVNNVVQAVARDVVVHLENELETRGIEISFTVHDSIVATCGATSEDWAAAQLVLEDVMRAVPRTLPERLWAMPIYGEAEPAISATYA